LQEHISINGLFGSIVILIGKCSSGLALFWSLPYASAITPKAVGVVITCTIHFHKGWVRGKSVKYPGSKIDTLFDTHKYRLPMLTAKGKYTSKELRFVKE
jgi:hypothetical protein